MPDQDALSAWLSSSNVVSAEGVVQSWIGPDRTGYPYPEAGGLWLSLFCATDSLPADVRARADAVAAWLSGEVHKHGAAGRGDLSYLFDSAIVLQGLVAHARARQDSTHAHAMERLADFIHESVATRRAARPSDPQASHWSLAYGSHLLKAVIALHAYADHAGDRASRTTASKLVEDLTPLFDGQRFVTRAGSATTYLHGSLYALEGLAYLQARGLSDHQETLDLATDWLTDAQLDSGGIPAFADPEGCRGAPRADSTAQATRLWVLVDREAFATPIASGLTALSSWQTEAGGVRYMPGSSHTNTWASLFTLQAAQWAVRPSVTAVELF